MTPGFPPDGSTPGLLGHDELAELVEQYRAGIEAELSLLRQLAVIAERQRAVTDDGNLAAFGDHSRVPMTEPDFFSVCATSRVPDSGTAVAELSSQWVNDYVSSWR